MKRLILAAACAVTIATPATATPYRDFVDLKRRATTGETVIRSFPNASRPSFKLILKNEGAQREEGYCQVWLEFPSRGHPIDHFEGYTKPTNSNRRALIQGPMVFPQDSLDDGGIFQFKDPFVENLHWHARGTNDALHLVRADVGVDEAGNCVAGTHVRFTSDLAYRDVVDSVTLTDYGEARLRGFPGRDPTFTLFLEYHEAGSVIQIDCCDNPGPGLTLLGDACLLAIEPGPNADPFWTRELIVRSEDSRTETEPSRFYLAGSGQDVSDGRLIMAGIGDPWVSNNTGEIFRVVDTSIAGGNRGCVGRVRVQWAPRIEDFYR
jgi:hypothetical protein